MGPYPEYTLAVNERHERILYVALRSTTSNAGGDSHKSRIRTATSRPWTLLIGTILAVLLGQSARAGGSAENAVVLIDPTDAVSVYVGHYYQAARNIPDCNVIYIDPAAGDWASHLEFQQAALLGTLESRGLDGFIDYVVVAPVAEFYVQAPPGLITDGCFPVNRFSLSSVYSFAFVGDQILSGGLPSSFRNHYFSLSNSAVAFDSETHWSFGSAVRDDSAPRYFIGAQLGCTAPLGNTVEELIAMIDRSVAADATHPDGRFYFMRTTDAARSLPRDPFFANVVSVIGNLGGDAVLLDAVLPIGFDDCLGVMTGWATPDIDGADYTVVDGAFCDHLTSFAATFDTASQTKLSEWITKGASGSVGAVEEPCNYPGKFPHPRVHAYYYQGASLGEAAMRSLEFLPFQGLLYGDPLTRPFASPPVVELAGVPASVVSGVFAVTPSAVSSTGSPVQGFQLYLDGKPVGDWVAPGEQFWVDTTVLADGQHELRVVAYDDTALRHQGRIVTTFRSVNHSVGVDLVVDATAGDLSTSFEFTATALGVPEEIQLLANGRVVAADVFNPETWTLLAHHLGAGPVSVRAVAWYDDEIRAVSDPILMEIEFDNPPSGDPGSNAPTAFGYTVQLENDAPVLLELPAADSDGSTLSYAVLTGPSHASLSGDGPYRLLTPNRDPCGSDQFVFSVSDGASTSAPVTVTIRYARRPFVRGEVNGDGVVDVADAIAILTHLFVGGPAPTPSEAGDVSADGGIDIGDTIALLDYLFGAGDPPAAPFPTVG